MGKLWDYFTFFNLGLTVLSLGTWLIFWLWVIIAVLFPVSNHILEPLHYSSLMERATMLVFAFIFTGNIAWAIWNNGVKNRKRHINN